MHGATSNGGVALPGAADCAIGLCGRLAKCFRDHRVTKTLTVAGSIMVDGGPAGIRTVERWSTLAAERGRHQRVELVGARYRQPYVSGRLLSAHISAETFFSLAVVRR